MIDLDRIKSSVRFLSFIGKIFWNGMAVLGVITLAGGMYGAYRAIQSYDLTPDQLVLKVAGKFGVQSPWVEKAVSPSPMYANKSFQGEFRSHRPRIFFRGNDYRQRLRMRYADDKEYRKNVDSVASVKASIWGAVGWACGENRDAGKKAVESLLGVELTLPKDVGEYGNAMDIAMAYDLLWDHPDWTTDARQRVNMLLMQSLRESLVVLDGKSASLWHGRFQLACATWVVAAAMDEVKGEDKKLLSRAQAHFLEAVNAITLSGGWPEGYNYWINNRAFPFVVACIAHMNAIDAPDINKRLSDALLNLGLWTIYGTEPTERFFLFGDSGPRNDLKDETQRVIDIISLATGLPTFRDYSRYILGIHRGDGYYSGYQWGIPLFRGQPEWDFSMGDGLKDISLFNGRLKNSAIFGREGVGQVFIRPDWGPDATFISYQAGHSFAHHGHYQAGHFTLTKKAPLAITSGTYGEYMSPHRLDYYIRTVAANSLLIMRPGEEVKPNRHFKENVSDGGQRIVMPTGSAVLNMKDWESNLYKGRHYEGGKITAYENSDPSFVYVGSDLTKAYNNTDYDDNGKRGKVSKVTRQLVYLTEEDLLIIRDGVSATDPSYTKKWLLHGWSKPRTSNERVLKGTADDGILETTDPRALIRHKDGELRILRLLPERGVMRKVGGPHYRYYVETDGDDTDLDGRNMDEGANEKPWYDGGLWRIEIQPEKGKKEDHFLVLLKPDINGKGEEITGELINAEGAEGVITRKTVVLFSKGGAYKQKVVYSVQGPDERLHVIVDAEPNREIMVDIDGKKERFKTTGEGVFSFRFGGKRVHQIVLDFGK